MNLREIGLAIQVVLNTLKEHTERIQDIPGFVTRKVDSAVDLLRSQFTVFASEKAEQVVAEHNGEFEVRLLAFKDQTFEEVKDSYSAIKDELVLELRSYIDISQGEQNIDLRSSVDNSFRDNIEKLNALQIALDNRLEQEVDVNRKQIALLSAGVNGALEAIRSSANETITEIRTEFDKNIAGKFEQVLLENRIGIGELCKESLDSSVVSINEKLAGQFDSYLVEKEAEFKTAIESSTTDWAHARVAAIAALDELIDTKRQQFEAVVRIEDPTPKFLDFLKKSSDSVDEVVSASRELDAKNRVALTAKLDALIDARDKQFDELLSSSSKQFDALLGSSSKQLRDAEEGIAALRREAVQTIETTAKDVSDKLLELKVEVFAATNADSTARREEFNQLVVETRAVLNGAVEKSNEALVKVSAQADELTGAVFNELAKYRVATSADIGGQFEAHKLVLVELAADVNGAIEDVRVKATETLASVGIQAQESVGVVIDTLARCRVETTVALEKETASQKVASEKFFEEASVVLDGVQVKATELVAVADSKIQEALAAVPSAMADYGVKATHELDKEITEHREKLDKLIGEANAVLDVVQVKVAESLAKTGSQTQEQEQNVTSKLSEYRVETFAVLDKRLSEFKVEPSQLDAKLKQFKDSLQEEFATEVASLLTDERVRVKGMLDNAAAQQPVAAPVVQVVDFADMEFKIEDDEQGHSFFAVVHKGSVVAKKELQLPRYKDIYRLDAKYISGDQATFDGSTWMALVDNPTAKPGERIGEWKLIAKRGEKGRNAVDGRSVKTHFGHKKDNVYHCGDFLHLHNRLWHCMAEKTVLVPDAVDIHSTREWALIGSIL